MYLVGHRFNVYTHVEGTTASLRLWHQRMESPLVALATCYDAALRLYITVNGERVEEQDLNWTDARPGRYPLDAVYSGSELNWPLANQLQKAVEVFRRYYGLSWHAK